MSGKKQSVTKITARELSVAMDRASQGDRAVMLRLRQLLRDNREQLNQLAADQCRTARDIHMPRDLYDQVQALAIDAHVDLLVDQLAAEGSSRVEQLLIARVTMCWLTLQTWEQEVAREYKRSPDKPPKWDKELTHAHRQFMRAVNELARLRMVGRLNEVEERDEAREDDELA